MDIIKMPSLISSGSTEQNLEQLNRYVWQMAEQLNLAMEETRRTEKQLEQKAEAALKQNKEQTPAASFGRIKDLIIKSAEIVEAYRTEITRYLGGEFVAVSDFGTYRQETEQKIRETDEYISQNLTAIQKIEGEFDEIKEMNAYIRTGYLYEQEDGIKRYGVEIGEQAEVDGVQQFKRFARMTSDRLSFYDANDIEVAYISDKRLYITYASCMEIKAKRAVAETLMVGSYVFSAGSDGHMTIS